MKTIKKRYDYLDLLKFIAMLMVISLHTGLWHNNFVETKSIGSFIQYCIRLICEGVPIFVLINGFLLMNKEINFKKHLFKMLKILFLIIFWSMLSYILISLVNKNHITFSNIINNTLLLNIRNPYNGPLWFLQNLLMLYFIYPVINHLFQNNKKIYYYLFFVVTFFTFVGGLLLSIENLHIFKLIININTFIKSINPISNGVFIFYFMLGGVIFDRLYMFDKKKNRIVIMIIGLAFYIFSILFTSYIFKFKNIDFTNNYIYGRITLAFIICGIFALLYTYKSTNRFYNIFIKSVGENTLGIFVMHLPIMMLLKKISILNLQKLSSRIFLFLLVFIVSYLLTILIKKIPVVKKIVTI